MVCATRTGDSAQASRGHAARVAWEELISSEDDGDGEPWSSASKRRAAPEPQGRGKQLPVPGLDPASDVHQT